MGFWSQLEPLTTSIRAIQKPVMLPLSVKNIYVCIHTYPIFLNLGDLPSLTSCKGILYVLIYDQKPQLLLTL